MFKKTYQQQKTATRPTPKSCFFCTHQVAIDFKDVVTLRRFVSSYMKIAPRRRSGLCALHQRRTSSAIKRARVMALMPYVPQ